MSGILAVMLMNAVSWIVTGAVTYIAISSTGNATWAFLLLIPAVFGYSYKEHRDDDKEKKNDGINAER